MRPDNRFGIRRQVRRQPWLRGDVQKKQPVLWRSALHPCGVIVVLLIVLSGACNTGSAPADLGDSWACDYTASGGPEACPFWTGSTPPRQERKGSRARRTAALVASHPALSSGAIQAAGVRS